MAPKSILVLSASQYLSGRPVSETVKADWAKPEGQSVIHKFDNIGLTVDPTDEAGTFEALETALRTRPWDGVIVGWCVRGHVEFTELFEKIVAKLTQEAILRPELKIMFSTGPANLVETTIRNFPNWST